MPHKAKQSCLDCRRLKRKCNRAIPSCSLCVRLGKACKYVESAGAANNFGNRQLPFESFNDSSANSIAPLDDQPLALSLNPFLYIKGPRCPQDPFAFFLDLNQHSELGTTALSEAPEPFVDQLTSHHLRSQTEREAILEQYFGTIHSSFPMFSRKRLVDVITSQPTSFTIDSCHGLLLMCMKLCITPPEGLTPQASPLYMQCVSTCAAFESAGYVSLRQVQSLVLVALFEFGHAIFPGAYLTISRAARLGTLLGLPQRNGQAQLFKKGEIWSLREEQRRTWWTIYILDRLINIEPNSLPFAVPNPGVDDLLPVNDDDWESGRVVPSESLYTTAFSSVTTLGPFSRMCQAAHMLGKVLNHREAKTLPIQDKFKFLEEAYQLHKALSALQASLVERHEDPSFTYHSLSAFSICTSAQLILYRMYACSEAHGAFFREPVALETEMQSLSLVGIKTAAFDTVPALALRQNSAMSPHLGRCLRDAAVECAWFIRENRDAHIYEALRTILHSLKDFSQRWLIGAAYLALLEDDDLLRLTIRES